MTTIEDKLKLFKNVVFEKVQKEKQKDVEQFESIKSERVNSLNSELELNEKATLADISKKANLKAQETIAREKLNRQHEILSLKETMLSEVMDGLSSKLREYTKTEEYAKSLKNSFESIVDGLQKGEYIAYLTEKDLDKFESSLKEIGNKFANGKIEFKTVSYDIIGGIIIEDTTGRMRIDNSLRSKLNDSKELVGIKVTEGLR